MGTVFKILFLCLLPLCSFPQVGAFVQGGFETFYNWNHFVVVGMQWKEHRVGLFHQQGRINPDQSYFIRQGIYGEANLGNIDKIAYLYAGFRLAQSNDHFVGFTPHATLSWRINKYVEIPQTFSIYASRLVASIGVRVMFEGRTKRKVQNTSRGTLQPAKTRTEYTH